MFTATFSASNPYGQTATESFTINVQKVDLPPVLAASDHNFIIGKTTSFALGATSPEAGAVLTYAALNLPTGATLDTNTGIVTWTPGPGQAGTYDPTFLVSDGILTTRDTIVMRAALTPPVPSVRIDVTPSFASVPGQPVIIHPVAAGLSAIVSLTLYENGVPVPLDANGQATITPTQPGKIQLLAVAVDADGTTGLATFTLKTRDTGDTTAPVVSFAAATQGAFIDVAGTINGTVSDSNLDSWTLEIAYGVGASVGTYTTLASGGDNVSGVLSQLDPATLRAGFYTLRLTATNINGLISTALTAIEADPLDAGGIYQRQVSDLQTTLDSIPFTLQRDYGSGAGTSGLFGPGWTLNPSDVSLQVNVPTTGLEAYGVYAPFADDTRLYLTRPDGVRTGFTFTPVAEVLGNVTVYHPAWTADDASGGWTLAMLTDATLVKVGGSYYDSATGLPYNPQGTSGATYLLTAADGTGYVINPAIGITKIETATGNLIVSSSGITAPDGTSLRFVLNSAGDIARAQTPDGTTIVYTYDTDGRLISARNIVTSADELYAYDSQGRLIAAVAGGGSGQSIGYHTASNGAVTVTDTPITADLGDAEQFAGHPRTDTLTDDGSGSGSAIYTFSLRPSELASAPQGSVILRVALTALGGETLQAPTIDGVTASSVVRDGNSLVALFALTSVDLYRLHVSGTPGQYTVALSFAGDVNLDGKVDGVDNTLEAGGSALADVNGDGVVNATDQELIAANYGVTTDSGPVLAATPPWFMTHVDLTAQISLAAVATDPFGDTLSYRIVSVQDGAISISADGQSLLFMPTTGFFGQASFTVVADDGFVQSAPEVVDVDVSNAALTHIDF